MDPIVVEVQGQVPAPLPLVYDTFRRADLTSIMRGYGPLPAVAAVEDQTGDWDGVGESRIIRLADGHGMLETLTEVEPPNGFAYTLSELTNVLRFLIVRFHGRWRFESMSADDEPPVVRAHWRYAFEPRSRLTGPLSRLILARYWRPYMAAALERASEEALAAHRG